MQINFIFTDNVGVCMYCVYCSKIKTSKINAKLSVRAETSNILIDFNGVFITSVLILLPFLSVTLHESDTRNALLGP